jgi:hypothetical protein
MELKEVEFHDSSLLSININYENGEVILNIIEATTLKSVKVIFNQFQNITIPREFPWGESFQINEATFVNGLIIQMQSGDEIYINGKFKECY